VHCIFSVHFSILVNNFIGFLNSSCGLRHGNPVSPLLFVIIMEALSKMVSAIVDRGFF
jgi:hypothetical protein